jgi:hypothetical protein
MIISFIHRGYNFLFVPIKEVHLIARRTQIATEISNAEQTKPAITAKSSQYLPTFLVINSELPVNYYGLNFQNTRDKSVTCKQ